MEDISLFLINVCNQFLSLCKLTESAPSLRPIFAGLRYKLDETIISSCEAEKRGVPEPGIFSLSL